MQYKSKEPIEFGKDEIDFQKLVRLKQFIQTDAQYNVNIAESNGVGQEQAERKMRAGKLRYNRAVTWFNRQCLKENTSYFDVMFAQEQTWPNDFYCKEMSWDLYQDFEKHVKRVEHNPDYAAQFPGEVTDKILAQKEINEQKPIYYTM